MTYLSNVNRADGVVILVLLLGFLIGRRNGLVKMLMRVVYSIASFGASLFFYPIVSGFIRQTPLFDSVKDGVISALGLETAVQAYTKQQEVNIISSLQLPDAFKDKMLENNNSVIYDLLGADSFVSYIGGFIAGVIINVVLVWVLFILFMFLLRVVLKGAGLISKLPVIRGIDRIGGALLGLFLAVLVIWTGCSIIYAFVTKPFMFSVYTEIAASKTAAAFYEHNLLLDLIMKRLF